METYESRFRMTWISVPRFPAIPKSFNDIPHYCPQAQAFDLPAVEYTARDVRSGLLFWAFAQHRSASASAVFIARIQQYRAAASRCAIWSGRPTTVSCSFHSRSFCRSLLNT